MVLSSVASTSYPRNINPVAEGDPRREGHSGRLFTLQQQAVANDETTETISQVQRRQPQDESPFTQSSLEKWMRLMGAARQRAYQQQQQPLMQTDPASMRYRLQRTYFDQERQATPLAPRQADQRLQAYRMADGAVPQASRVNFVV